MAICGIITENQLTTDWNHFHYEISPVAVKLLLEHGTFMWQRDRRTDRQTGRQTNSQPPTKIWKLNMLRIYPVELSRVELCRRCVRARRLSWPSLQSAANRVGLEVAGSRLATAASWLRSHRRHDTTWLRCRQIVQTRRDCRQLVANSIHTAERNSTRQLSCVGVGGVYWA